MAKVGRKSKFTPERAERIVSLIRAGNYKETAAKASGISESTLYAWLAKKGPRFVEFLEAVKKAEAEAEARHVAIIAKAAEKTWQAAAWYLERIHPDRYGRRERHEITGAKGGAIQTVDLSNTSTEALRDHLATIRKSLAADGKSSNRN